MRQTVKSKYIVDFVVEKSTDVQTPEPEAVRDKVKVLRDMAGFEQDEAITALPVFENRPFEERRNEDDERRLQDDLRLHHRGDEPLGSSPAWSRRR